ncbi:MAG: tRNA (adenosine(37)-N6)-threonylcarbamoyltransferase complex ATPase subunit type 1 TsaE [Persicimonas sp.]
MEPVDFHPGEFGLEDRPDLSLELDDEEATRRLAGALAGHLEAADFVGLVGPLGAGKTTFVQGLVAALGAPDEATSPTYTLVNEYATDPPVVHVDLYRLEHFDELESIAYWDYVESNRHILCVEWLDRLPDAWPRRGIVVALRHRPKGRQAQIWATDHLQSAVAELEVGTPGG